MSDETEQLRETLSELERQLAGVDALDAELAERLQACLEDVQSALEASATGPEQHRSLAARVSDLALHFEADHPTIAGTLNRVTHMLSSLGI